MACVIFHFGKIVFFRKLLFECTSKFKHGECVLRSVQKKNKHRVKVNEGKQRQKQKQNENIAERKTWDKKKLPSEKATQWEIDQARKKAHDCGVFLPSLYSVYLLLFLFLSSRFLSLAKVLQSTYTFTAEYDKKDHMNAGEKIGEKKKRRQRMATTEKTSATMDEREQRYRGKDRKISKEKRPKARRKRAKEKKLEKRKRIEFLPQCEHWAYM